MTTFVLVHGAWVGEWCYDPIIPLLEARGHRALAVSLTGFGRKKHLHNPNISILDHIQDVVNFVESHDLDDITLVGHSYGGSVITGVWDQLRAQVSELFYLDAGTPDDGESHFDSMLKFGGGNEIQSLFGRALSNGQLVRDFPIKALRKRDPVKASYMQDKVMPFPFKCITTPLQFKYGALPTGVPKNFILCKKNISYHHQQAESFRSDDAWNCFEIDTFHDCMWEDPVGLVEILAPLLKINLI